ncbi:hypothetical protein, partial [Hydrogenophaga sp.]|uniref:hypothetical protein n=1 Tax=Hydrogenophaga sp. TaxID=1904254 RepID=UPI0025B803BD
MALSAGAQAQTTVTNVASIAPPTGVVNTNPSTSCTGGVCSAQDTDAVTPSADLSLTKVSANPNVAVGQTVTFTLTISNAGPSPVTNTTFTDVVPANFTAVSIVSSTGATASVSGSTVNGTTSLASGGNASVVVRAVASSVGNYTNTATVTPPLGTTDPTPTNNTGTQTGTIAALADVSTVISVTPNGTPGSVITATVTFANAGPSTADSVTGTVVLPDGTTQTVVIGSLPSGSSTVTVVNYTVPAGSTTVQNWTAGVATVTPESTLANNTVTAATPLSPLADVSTVISV